MNITMDIKLPKEGDDFFSSYYKERNVMDSCLCANSSVVYGLTLTKLGREAGDWHSSGQLEDHWLKKAKFLSICAVYSQLGTPLAVS